MGSREWPGWLKGALYFLIIGLFSIFFWPFWTIFAWGVVIVTGGGGGGEFLMGTLFNLNCVDIQCSPTLQTFIVFIIIGALLGLIVDKIRSKKQPQQINNKRIVK